MRATIGPDGLLRAGPLILRAAIGRSGISHRKQEGDGATPAGILPLRRVLYRADRLAPPRCKVPLEPIAPNDGWCDDPDSAMYNRPIMLPFDASHEELWRADALYDVIGVLGWNDSPPERGRGSAIFLHVATRDYAPTAGCVALARQDLLAILAAGLTGIEVRDDLASRR
jgi:L,D-peptidoglycan transpeptidase YkuD (ErfK/YbiS/YcfS/YnhG family)